MCWRADGGSGRSGLAKAVAVVSDCEMYDDALGTVSECCAWTRGVGCAVGHLIDLDEHEVRHAGIRKDFAQMVTVVSHCAVDSEAVEGTSAKLEALRREGNLEAGWMTMNGFESHLKISGAVGVKVMGMWC